MPTCMGAGHCALFSPLIHKLTSSKSTLTHTHPESCWTKHLGTCSPGKLTDKIHLHRGGEKVLGENSGVGYTLKVCNATELYTCRLLNPKHDVKYILPQF